MMCIHMVWNPTVKRVAQKSDQKDGECIIPIAPKLRGKKVLVTKKGTPFQRIYISSRHYDAQQYT